MKNHYFLLFIILFVGSVTAQKKSTSVEFKNLIPHQIYQPKHLKNTHQSVLFIFTTDSVLQPVVKRFHKIANELSFLVVVAQVNEAITYDENIRNVRALFSKVDKQYALNYNQIYTIGIKEGAKVATSMASIYNKVKGVIACGSAMPSLKYTPKKNTFSFVAISNDENPRLFEIQLLLDYLNYRKFDTEFHLYAAHNLLPPEKVVYRVLQRFKVKAMNKGYIKIDSLFIDNAYQHNLAVVDTLVNKGKLLDAYDELSYMMNTFRFYKNIKPLKLRQREIKRRGPYRLQKQYMSNTFTKEIVMAEQYLLFLQEDMAEGNLQDLGFWDYEIKELTKQEKSKNAFNKKMAIRLKNLIFETTNHLLKTTKDTVKQDTRLFGNILLTLVKPNYYKAYLNSIQIACNKNDYGMALYYTEELFKNGFTNLQALKETEGTALLRIMPEFKEIVNKYLK